MDKQIIEKILDNAEVAPGMDILDISAGEHTIGFCFTALCRRA